MITKRTIEDIDLAGKTVLVRVDFNVPFKPGTTEIADDIRVKASIPTIEWLRGQMCRVVLCSHLGRPEGKVVDDMRLAPVSTRLSELLGVSVGQAPDCIGNGVKALVDNLASGDVLMLENTRFHPGEEMNASAFAMELASFAEAYVNDAFAVAHRAHGSTEGVAHHLPAVAGFLLAKELEMLGQTLDSHVHPCMAVFGGAKVSDKLAVLQRLVTRVDTLIVGGGMAATFLVAQGFRVGASLLEEEMVADAKDLLHTAARGKPDLLLPIDVVVSDGFSADAEHQTVDVDSIPDGWMVMDIGPKTSQAFTTELRSAKTVVWNGPAGVFEWPPFSDGTKRIAETIAGLNEAVTVIGGGSTAEAVVKLGLVDKMTHVSTGGGASMEFLEGKTLPGVAVLMDK